MRTFFILILLIICVSPAMGFPVSGGNASGANRMFMAPAWDAPRPLADGAWSASLDLSYSNEFASMASQDHAIVADMEAFNAVLGAAAGFRWGMEASLQARFASLHSGFLDSGLTQWHDALGVGNSGRSVRPDDEFGYQICSRGACWFSDPGQAMGVESIRLGVKKQVTSGRLLDVSLKGAGQWSAGDSDQGLGSGSADVQFMALADWKPHEKLVVSLGAGRTWTGRPDYLKGVDMEIANPWFGGLGLTWRAWERLSLFVQAAWQDSIYSGTGIPVMDRDYGEITFGGLYALSETWSMHLALAEDLSRSAADFTLHTGLKAAF